MDQMEILLLNYFSVLFLTISLSIFINKPEKLSDSFSIWSLLGHLILAFFVYKVIQIYDGFYATYVANILIFLALVLSRINRRSQKKKNKISSLAATIPSLQKLSTDEFSKFLSILLRAYGFQSVKQVTVESDDKNQPHDTFLLARHEGNLIEIRFLSGIKFLSENHINAISGSFRDSTSQATSWLLATSAKADENTNIYVRNSGVDIKIFDITTISNLAYVLAPDHKPSTGLIKTHSINLIDYLLNKLSIIKSNLKNDDISPTLDKTYNSPQHAMSNALGENLNAKLVTIELFEENGVDSTTDTANTTSKQKRRRKKKNNNENTNQGALNLPETKEVETTNNDVILAIASTTALSSNEILETSLDADKSVDVDKSIEITEDSDSSTNQSTNNEDIDSQDLNEKNQILELDTNPDITADDEHEISSILIDGNSDEIISDVSIEVEFDPMASFDELTQTGSNSSKIDEMDDFATTDTLGIDILGDLPTETVVDLEEPQTSTTSNNDPLIINHVDLLLVESVLEPQILNDQPTENEISIDPENFDISIDLADLGAEVPVHSNTSHPSKK